MNDALTVLQNLNWAVLAPFLFLQFVLMVVALVDCIKKETTNGPKWIWVLVIIFVNIIGPILYFIFGRGER